MKRRDPAVKTFQRMKESLARGGYTPTDSHIEVGDVEQVLCKGGIESYQFQDPEKPQFTFVTLLLSEPHSSLRHSPPRYSIEVRYRAVGQDQGSFYGRFSREGKPLDNHAREIQSRLFFSPSS